MPLIALAMNTFNWPSMVAVRTTCLFVPAAHLATPRPKQRLMPVGDGDRPHAGDGRNATFTREYLAIETGRTFTARDVILTLQYLFAVRGAPGHVRSDNGPQFIAKEIQCWLEWASVGTLYIQKVSPWENGDVESFNGKLRDELLNRELFLSLSEVRYVLDEWRLEYHHRRSHSGIGWQTPAAYAAKWKDESTGALPAATQAGPSVGASPLRAAPPANHQQILSHQLV